MRHKVIEARQEVFNHNEHEVSKRWAFEEGVGVLFVVYWKHVFFLFFDTVKQAFIHVFSD